MHVSINTYMHAYIHAQIVTGQVNQTTIEKAWEREKRFVTLEELCGPMKVRKHTQTVSLR